MDVLSLPLGGPFKAVVADPPYPFKDKLPGRGRGAAKHYPLMSLGQIAECLPALEFSGLQIEPEAHLYLWVPNPFLESGFAIARAWGFIPKQVITWVKVTTRAAALVAKVFDTQQYSGFQEPGWQALNSKGVLRIGMGRGFRNCTEQVIVAKRGRLPFNERWRPNVIFAPRTLHSRKPDVFYEIVEAMSPAPLLELFARPPMRVGWAVWGNEV